MRVGWSIRLPRLVRRVKSAQASLATLDDSAIRRQSLALRYRLHAGEPAERLLPEAYGLVCESARRTLKMLPYEMQLRGAIAMHFGTVAEMHTGEGKTLTATMPLYLAALAGHGAHLATANDYLAARDAETVRPLFELLGLAVGVVESQTSRPLRARAYRCDITYGTAKEFGFDFLRDRLLDRQQAARPDLLGRMLGHTLDGTAVAAVQRELHFILVDEADSILIDEARTPLIISSLDGAAKDAAQCAYVWAASAVGDFEERSEYDYDPARRQVTLNPVGRRRVRESAKPETLAEVGMYELYEHMERAIKVARDFQRDRHYVVRDDEIVIVDEFTGRLAEGRKWRDGIHQALEAKERLEVSVKADEAARITIQDFFLQYQRLAGMTGTAYTSRRELNRIYKLRVVSVPTQRPCIRRQLPDVVCGTSELKWRSIVAEVQEMHAAGRPVLIGTRSIDKSEHLSLLLTQAGLPHQVLNARHVAAEARIIAEAGKRGRITVATNMAGRGTDIQLAPGVAELGGLHVICSELHESARVDRQLIGRCARQGDPGSFRQYMALDDDILRSGFGPRKAYHWRQFAERRPDAIPSRFAGLFRRAQARVERDHFRQRRLLLYHERQRRLVQEQLGQDPHLDSPV